MNTLTANVCAELGYEKLIQLQEEMIGLSLRMPENTALLCTGFQKLLAYFS